MRIKIVFLIALVMACAACTTTDGFVKDDVKIQLADADITIVYDGQNVFYQRLLDDESGYELTDINVVTNESTVIDKGWYFSGLTYDEENLYYTRYEYGQQSAAIIKYDKTGDEKEELFTVNTSSVNGRNKLYVNDDDVYYLTSYNELYRYTNDELTCLKTNVEDFSVYEDMMFYSNTDGVLFSADRNIENEKQLFSSDDFYNYMEEKGERWVLLTNISNIRKNKETLYFLVSDARQFNNSGKIMKYNLEQGSYEGIDNIRPGQFNIYENLLYCYGKSEEKDGANLLYICNLNGKNIKYLENDMVVKGMYIEKNNIFVCGYVNDDSVGILRILDIDGDIIEQLP